MKPAWYLLILLVLIIYEKIWRPIVCRKKIYSCIEGLGGLVYSIIKLTQRDEIYSVYYTENGQMKHFNVKFNLFYKAEWE